MKADTCFIEGLKILSPTVFSDPRGSFYESYSKRVMADFGIHQEFVQDNQSVSHKGVLRGLHFQISPHAQSKLVRVSEGSVWDIAVDLRPESKTYGAYFGLELNDANQKQFYIPAYFAHGFLVLSERAVFQYKCSEFYYPALESGIRFDDPDLNIEWPLEIEKIQVSPKDKILPSFKEYSLKNGKI